MSMLFDDIHKIKEIDPENVIDQIRRTPDQIYSAWHLGISKNIPRLDQIYHIVFIGVGESAISAELVKVYIEPLCALPITIFRNYELPKWVHGEHILVIGISHTGNTIETQTAMKKAHQRGCTTVTISTGGGLLDFAKENNTLHCQYYYEGHRAFALGYVFGLTLGLLHKAGFIPDQSMEIETLVKDLKQLVQHNELTIQSPMNPSKRLAGQLINRSVMVVGADFLSPVAKRWKNQINTTAKAWAQFDTIPELNHNTQECIYYPDAVVTQLMVIFLRSPLLHEQNLLRVDLTKKSFMLAGVGTDQVDGRGNTLLSQIWTSVLFGDLVAYYLAIAYATDPASIDNIEDFQLNLKN
jgi:glucose/mannose-6-phosphate isomerase